MKVKQVSIFLENESGRLAQVTNLLGRNNVNIRALSIADTDDFGILRLIVTNPDKAVKILKHEGFTVSITDVLAVEIKDCPGGLAEVLAILENKNVNIEYLYAFVQKASAAALVVFRVEQIDEAIEVLTKNGISLLNGNEVYTL